MRPKSRVPMILWAFLAVIAIASVLTHGNACAQTTTSKLWTAKPAPTPCWPIVSGGTGFVTDAGSSNGQGYGAGWWCPGKFKPSWVIKVTMHEFAPKLSNTELMAIINAKPDSANAALEAAQTAAIRMPTGNYGAAYDQIFLKIQGMLAATKPADPAWVVGAQTADDGTRPAYQVNADGTRNQTAAGRAPSGVSCLTTQRAIEEGSTVYASWQGGPQDQVAVCKLKG